ncbi:MAG: TRAP transporter substrate-binding protein [Alphaproteobacteria bacterium]
MDRRTFLKNAGLATGAAAATTLAAPAIAQGRTKLTMVTSWPRGAAGVWDVVEHIVATVNEMSDGTLEIDAKAGGELVGPFESFDAVSSGQADIYHAADYYFIGQSPALALFTAIPFGMTAPEMMVWYYHRGGRELQHELGEIFNLKSFIAGNTGAQGGGWFRSPIKSAEDFNGLKFRMPGLGGQTVSKLGASVQNVAGGEIYQALASGALDATEWIGPWSDEALGLHEVAKHYYPAGFHEPGAALSTAVNLDVFNGLSLPHQKIIEYASAEAHQWLYSLYIANNGAALGRLVTGGVTTHTFTDDVWDAYGAAAAEVIEETRSDALFARIHDSYMSSMRQSANWISQSDGFYTAQRARVLGF